MKKTDFLGICQAFPNSEYWFYFFTEFMNRILMNDNFLLNKRQSDINFLPFYIQKKITLIQDIYKKQFPNDNLIIFETYRSQYRQQQVFKDGASKVKTNGMHFFGLAVDLVNFINNKITWDLRYNWLHDKADKLQIWKCSNSDLCHFQFITLTEQNQYRSFFQNCIKIIQSKLNITRDGICGRDTYGQTLINSEMIKEFLLNQETV